MGGNYAAFACFGLGEKGKGAVVLSRYSQFIRCVSVVGFAALLSACREDTATMEDFPPMSNDNPPGASDKAVATANALGRGINFDRMFEWTTVGVDFPEADLLIAKAKEG